MALKDKFVVRLTPEQRHELARMARSGKHPARALVHARILLKADTSEGGPGWDDAAVAEALECGERTVARARKRFVEGGLEAALHRRRPTGRRYRELDGEQEARLVALARSPPPDGRSRWTLKLLADRLVELEVVDAISDETVRRALGRIALKPWLRQQWVIPPKASAPFVAAREDVLAVYERPRDEARPVVCVDEAGKQLIGDARPPLPMRPGRAARVDYEYVRNGTANLFLAFEPLAGVRHVVATARRANRDFAEFVRRLVDDWYPGAERVVLVLDNLSTHTPAALYEAFEPPEARRLVERLEWHYTPRHGSWLNVAEIELSVLARQCLDRRIPDIATLQREAAAWEGHRNREAVRVDWQFTTADARVRLKQLYPVIETATSAVAEH